ncbi:MAG: class I SAM-dependent methyltransferase [Parvibaculum sp.]
METDPFRVFLDMQLRLKRNAPGGDRATAHVLSLLGPLPTEPEILVMGCGQGSEVLTLLRKTDARVSAVDIMKPFIAKLEERAEAEAITGERLLTICSDFEALDLPSNYFDLIWSEGAIYSIGFEEGLNDWKRYLKPSSFLVASELSWMTATPDEAARTFWEKDYPDMAGVEENIARAARAGFDCVATYQLPDEDWWTDYYQPLVPLIEGARRRHAGDAGVENMLDEQEAEIRLFERCANDYAYIFYVLQLRA